MALANEMTPSRPYRHRVDILADGQVLNWPILLSDIQRQSRAQGDLSASSRNVRTLTPPGGPPAANFEEWCLELMGPILYERFIRPYTEKQWGRPARRLSAAWAPRRVSVRWDNDPYLFPDPFQGWPAGANGYTDLIDGLLANDSTTLRTGVDVSLANLDKHMREAAADLVVLTCPLDVFCDFRQG